MLRLSSKAYLFLAAVAMLILIAGWSQLQRSVQEVSMDEVLVQDLNELNENGDRNRRFTLYIRRCAACHGDNAEGNKFQMTGSLASMPRWYLEEQLQKFRDGLRGTHPKDIHGQRMKAVTEALDLDEQIQIIDYLEKIPPVAQKSTMEGDAEWGRELFDVNCAMCHRYNAQGMVGFKSAPLNGQQDWYLLAQMEKFDQRIRGYHDDDTSGHKMHRELDATPSREDRLAILAYISSLSESYPIKKN